jgi:hypothetical protein
MTDRTTPQDSPNSQEDQSPSQGISRRQFLGTGAAAVTLLSSLPAEATSPAVNAGSVFRIHPAIGIARMGNASPDSFFIGPEVPGFGPTSLGAPAAYKSNGQVKPQAARFRVWEYRNDPATGRLVPIGEVTLGTQNVTSIRWTAHLANKKASFYGFHGPAGESSPYVSADADTTPGALRNASVADRASLEIDFGARSISGPSQPPVLFAPDAAHQIFPRKPNGDPVIDYLGQLRTDADGRLIVIGGAGKAGYIGDAPTPLASYANNDGWFDDASDGPVTATITYVDGAGSHEVQADGAWVLCAPPDFAPRVRPIVTLYDLLSDMAVRFLPVPANSLYYGGPLDKIRALKAAYVADPNNEFPGYVPAFADDVFPVLRAAYDMWWVTALVNRKHTSLIDPNLGNPDPAYDTDRQGVFIYVRPPLNVNSNITGPMTMPHLLGDDPYSGKEPDSGRKMTVTHVQYGMLRNWAAGSFTPPLTKVVPPSPLPPPPGPGLITPDGLDRAALENAQGGGFFPGIEVGWQIRNPNLFKEPFRLDLNGTSQYIGDSTPIGPGHFSRQGAVPWHADFNDCRHEGDYGWWPAQRPDDALPSYAAQQRLSWARPNNASSNQQQNTSHEDMVANWWKYGFIVEVPDPAGVNPPQLVETERNPTIP